MDSQSEVRMSTWIPGLRWHPCCCRAQTNLPTLGSSSLDIVKWSLSSSNPHLHVNIIISMTHPLLWSAGVLIWSLVDELSCSECTLEQKGLSWIHLGALLLAFWRWSPLLFCSDAPMIILCCSYLPSKDVLDHLLQWLANSWTMNRDCCNFRVCSLWNLHACSCCQTKVGVLWRHVTALSDLLLSAHI